MGRYKKWIIGAVVFFVLFTIIGFFVIPPIVKPYLLETLSSTLNRQVSLSDLSLNPYTLTVTLRGFEIKEPKGETTFVSFDELVANLDIRSIFKQAPVVEEFIIRKPYVHLVRNKDKTYNFSDLLALIEEEPTEKKKEPALFSVNNIVIENGGVDFIDGPFDTIISLDVFEHLAEPLPVVDGLIERLAPGGRLIVTAYFGATKSHPMHFDHDIDLGAYLRAAGLRRPEDLVHEVLAE